MNSTQWKKVVREFWKKPLSEQEENELLTEGELTLVRGVSRKQFLGSFDHKDGDVARGMEWRAGDAHSEVGDIIIIRFPYEPHEAAAGALLRAVTRSIDMRTPNSPVGDATMSTGAVRCTGGARSSEADGGFRPVTSPVNSVAGKGETNLKVVLLGYSFLLNVTIYIFNSLTHSEQMCCFMFTAVVCERGSHSHTVI